jgi:hypothetical protein
MYIIVINSCMCETDIRLHIHTHIHTYTHIHLIYPTFVHQRMNMKHGVLQGSILRPLLFLIHIYTYVYIYKRFAKNFNWEFNTDSFLLMVLM